MPPFSGDTEGSLDRFKHSKQRPVEEPLRESVRTQRVEHGYDNETALTGDPGYLTDCRPHIGIFQCTHDKHDVEADVGKGHRLKLAHGWVYLSDIAHAGRAVPDHCGRLIHHRDTEVMGAELEQGTGHDPRATPGIQQIAPGAGCQEILNELQARPKEPALGS